jgi:hypothetical protein
MTNPQENIRIDIHKLGFIIFRIILLGTSRSV